MEFVFFYVTYDFAHFYVKRDCLLFCANVKLFFEFFVMREKANQLLAREIVFRRGIGDLLVPV